MGDEAGQDNIEACSLKNELHTEECSSEDHFDKCMVFQAFSTRLNKTIFKRECTTEKFCTSAIVCNDPDYNTDCRFDCCTGDLCNNFDFKYDATKQKGAEATKVPQVLEKPQTKTSIEKEKIPSPSHGPTTYSGGLAGPTIRRETPMRAIKTSENSGNVLAKE